MTEHYLWCFVVSKVPSCTVSSTAPKHPFESINNSIPFTENCINCTTAVNYSLSKEAGLSLCTAITIATLLFGIFGIFTNLLTAFVVIKKASFECSITTLILVLTFYDVVSCISGSATNVSFLLALGEYRKTEAVLKSIYGSLCLLYTARTLSVYTTILITLERLLAVCYPHKARVWFTKTKAKIYCGIVFVFSIILNQPHWLSYNVAKNPTYPDDNTDFPYKLQLTLYAKPLLHFGYGAVVADFIFPLFFLIFLNILIVLEIRNANKRRLHLTLGEQGEISIARVFIVVFVVLLLCHILPMYQQFIKVYKKSFPKEMAFSTAFCTVFNSSVNFLIYCMFGKQFRIWAKEVICCFSQKKTRSTTFLFQCYPNVQHI